MASGLFWEGLALTLPEGFDARPFFTALLAACDTLDTVLAGGDLARGPVAPVYPRRVSARGNRGLQDRT